MQRNSGEGLWKDFQMKYNELSIEARKVIDELASSEIGSYIDTYLPLPCPFHGRGKITF
jgi:hypothetical protein